MADKEGSARKKESFSFSSEENEEFTSADQKLAVELDKKFKDFVQKAFAHRNDRVDLHSEIQRIRCKLKAKERDEAVVLDGIARLEIESQLELYGFKKAQWEIIEKQKREIDVEIEKRLAELETIKDIEKEKNDKYVQLMKCHLENRDMEQELGKLFGTGTGGEEKSVMEVCAPSVMEAKNGEKKFRLIDEVLNLRREERAREKLKSQETMQKLNEKRKDILNRREGLARKKQQHDLLIEKGVEFLREMEMGNVPPVEFVNRNSSQTSRGQEQESNASDRESTSKLGEIESGIDGEAKIFFDREGEASIEDVVAIAKQNMNNTGKLERLRKEQEKENFRNKKKEYKGELGPESYSNWQMETYYMCRELALWIVNEFLTDKREKIPGYTDIRFAEELWHSNKKALEKQMEIAELEKLGQDVLNDLLGDLVDDMVKGVVVEMLKIQDIAKSLSEGLLLKVVENIGTKVYNQSTRSTTLQGYLSNAFEQMKKDRSKAQDVYRHSQRFSLLPKQTVAVEFSQDGSLRTPLKEKEDEKLGQGQEIKPLDYYDEVDTIVISLQHLRPTTFVPEESRSRFFCQYVKAENTYWNRISITSSEKEFKKNYGGFARAAVSTNSRMIAVSSLNGSLLIFWCRNSSLEPLAFFETEEKNKPVILDIKWSMDSSRLLTLDDKFTVKLWSLTGWNTSIVKEQFSNIMVYNQHHASNNSSKEQADYGTDETSGYRYKRILLLLAFKPLDFIFKQGPFAAKPDDLTDFMKNPQHENIPKPVSICFHPSCTLFGTQPCFMVGMSNGDIIKCNTSLSKGNLIFMPLLKPHLGIPNIIIGSQEYTGAPEKPGMRAELFRSHKFRILNISFVDHFKTMVSVDAKGFIKFWKYEEQSYSGFGWFNCEKTFRLELAETTFIPKGAAKTPFTDKLNKTKKNRHEKSKFEQSVERTNALDNIRSLRLPEPPWHSEKTEDKGHVSIFAPQRVGDNGALFHIIEFSEHGQLSSHIVQKYEPAKNFCTVILSTPKLSCGGNSMTFMLLFNEFLPKDPHISFVSVKLISEGSNIGLDPTRIDIPLSAEEFNQLASTPNLCSFEISPVSSGTGGDYLYAYLFDRVHIYSLTTGQEIRFGSSNMNHGEYLTGKAVNKKDAFNRILISPNSRLVMLKNNENIFSFSQTSTTIFCFKIEDKNSAGERSKTFHLLPSYEQTRLCNYVHRTKKLYWLCDGSEFANVTNFLQKIVNGIVESAMRSGSSRDREGSSF
eukprot:Nk52_evm2s89 gene=Nk52_evmTU2s89